MNEQELIANILAGNKNLYKQLIDIYQQRVFRVCMGFVHNREDAGDITQEVFINIYLNLGKFRGKSAFSTWIHRITINACLNHLKKTRKKRDIERLDYSPLEERKIERMSIEEEIPDPDKALMEKHSAMEVRKAIDSLPERQRIAFVLSRYDELPQKKISQIMNVSEGAVEQLLQRARANLQKKLEFLFRP